MVNMVRKRGTMMQTCIDAGNDKRLDIALMNETDLHRLNYKKDRLKLGSIRSARAADTR